MVYPILAIDLDAVEHNARVVVELCAAFGISVTGVTKGVCGDAEIAKAMLRGGVDTLAEKRNRQDPRLRPGDYDDHDY